MTKPLFKFFLSIALLSSFYVNAQTISNFESFAVTDTFFNGVDFPLGHQYQDGNVAFENYYDTSFGGFWSGGFAISGIQDSTTAGFTNLYGAITAKGEGGSDAYAVGNNFAKAFLTGNASGKQLDGLHITNTTFAALSMRDGDNFAKKFGGPDGNDPDWFKLEIFGSLAGNITDTVEFFLADFRFIDNTKDYIIKNWKWIDLKPLGNVDTLIFVLSSSDVGQFGMNTPAFFAIDNLKTLDSGLELEAQSTLELSFFPNPASNFIRFTNVSEGDKVEIFNLQGLKALETTISDGGIDISMLSSSTYLINVITEKGVYTSTLVKN